MKNNRSSGTSRRVGRIPTILLITSAASLVAVLATAHAADPPAVAAPDQAAPAIAPATAPAAPVPQADTIQPTPAASPSPTPEKSGPVDIEVFHGVQILSGPKGNPYPAGEVVNGREGWVTLNTMIDPNGKPYEAMVVGSSGNPAFEKAALKTVQLISFAPARQGDTPIDSSFTFKLKFAIRDLGKGASEKFGSNYRKFTKAIAAGDKATADTILAKLEAENLYEEAFEHYGRYYYYVKWGEPADQLKELSLAIAGEKRPEYLPKEAFVTALIAMFTLEVKAGNYGDALSTWATLDPLTPKDRREGIVTVVEQIKALQRSTQPYPQAALIGENSNWSSHLLRDSFSIDVKSGAVSEIKLRCQKQYLFFKYEPGLVYSIGRQKDQCHIEVVGDPGTKFVLTQ
jgi:TonB family protein